MQEGLPNLDIISQARYEWGDHYAQSILGNIIRSVAYANEKVSPPYAVDRLQLGIRDLPDAYLGIKALKLIGLHTQWSGFAMLMDRTSPQEVNQEVEETVLHETARVRIFQERYLAGYYKNNDELGPIDTVIEDGIVVSTVASLLSDNTQYLLTFGSGDTPRDIIMSHLKAIINLQPNKNTTEAKYLAITVGSEQFPRRGYKIGHAIVQSAMQSYNFTVDDLFKQPPDLLAEYAKVMLNDGL